jgi:hypothetical protein
MQRAVKNARERFWGSVDIRGRGECWPWKKSLTHDGYGRFSIGRRCEHRTLIAHRVAWEFTNGPVPAGLYVLHTCDNPACCNPAHHFLGTNLDNMRDKCSKRRQALGEKQGSAQLTAEQVTRIRDDRKRGRTYQELAIEYGVSKSNIASIAKGLTWKHI